MDPKKIWRWVTIGIAALVATALFYALRNALVPVGVALILAYLLDPVIDRFEARKINRSAAILILAAVVAVVITVAGGFLVFQAQRELVKLYHNLPDYLTTTQAKLEAAQGRVAPYVKKYTGYELPATLDEVVNELKNQVPNIDTATIKPLSGAIKKISSSTMAFFGWALGLVIIPVFLFYFLRDWDRMKKSVVDYIPLSYRDYVVDKAVKIDEILGAFIRGQLTVCLVLGVFYSIGLMIVGIDLAVVIGMIGGLLFIVPYLGTIVGVVSASLMALLAYGLSWHLIGVWAVFAIVQTFEGTVLTPRVMGDRVGLSPVVVIFSLLVGSDLLGILGMLIAVPVAAVIKVFVDEAIDNYRHSKFFLEEEQTPKDGPGEPGSGGDQCN
jgi:predicted PurR-regulated permease PerM